MPPLGRTMLGNYDNSLAYRFLQSARYSLS
jgi:hypothetical protein